MKKTAVLFVAMVMVMALLFAGCAGEDSGPAGVGAGEVEAPADKSPEEAPEEPEAAPELTREEVEAVAMEVFQQLQEYAGRDIEAFAALFTNTTEERIQQHFEQDYRALDLDKHMVVEIGRSNPYYYVNVIGYIVAGISPDTNLQVRGATLTLANVDGEWKVESSESADEIFDNLRFVGDRVFPEDFRSAYTQGRNAIHFHMYEYNELVEDAVFEGAVRPVVKYVWQEESGDVLIGLLFSNGTETNVHFSTGDIYLETQAGKEIVDLENVALNTSVAAGKNKMSYFRVPADEVKTGTEKWDSAVYSLDARFK